MESKNEILTNMEKKIRLLEKALLENSNNNTFELNQRILDFSTLQSEMTHQINKKNMLIQTLKYENSIDDLSENETNGKNSKLTSKEKHHIEELETSNKLIMRKNIEILSLSGTIVSYEKILNVIEQYLDKKQVRGIDISIMEHPCINKLRMLLREKNVFEKELLNQLNDHNKKFATIENELSERSDSERMGIVINDNRRLTTTIINLQNTIGILEKELAKTQKDSEFLKQSIQRLELENAQHRESIKEIQNSAKYELNEMNKQMIKLSEQNNELTKRFGTQEERNKVF